MSKHTQLTKTYTERCDEKSLPVGRALGHKPSVVTGEVTEMADGKSTYDPEVKQLLNMLTYKRPAGSESEEEFLDVFIRPLKGNVDTFTEDGFGNIFVRVGVTNGETLFSCHTDSVHRTSGRQVVAYDPFTQLIYKSSQHTDNECLGADDAAGVALLLEMIKAEVPGWYAFFRCEERGGQGSTFAAESNATFLSGFKRAIAFDRKGSTSVITHQAGGRCCSDAFAKALAEEFNLLTNRSDFSPDSTGVFTDTANFTELIAECTNVSVCYDSEHTVNESLDLEAWLRLRAACIQIDWEALPTVRDPKVKDYGDWGYGNYGWNKSSGALDFPAYEPESAADEVMQMTFGKLVTWVKNSNPEDVAEIIFELTDRIYAMQDEQFYDRMDTANLDDNDDDGYNTDRLDVGLR